MKFLTPPQQLIYVNYQLFFSSYFQGTAVPKLILIAYLKPTESLYSLKLSIFFIFFYYSAFVNRSILCSNSFRVLIQRKWWMTDLFVRWFEILVPVWQMMRVTWSNPLNCWARWRRVSRTLQLFIPCNEEVSQRLAWSARAGTLFRDMIYFYSLLSLVC